MVFPLAIELVGGYLKRRRESISFGDYLQFLRSEPLERLEELFPSKTFTDHDKSIIRTLKISEGLLKETRYLEDILDVLAWSGTSSIGYSLLKELVWTTDDLAFRDGLGIALELHFIKKEEGTGRYAIHRLLARVRQFEKPLAERKEWHEKIVAALEKWFRKKDDESKILSEGEIEYDHLLIWQERTSHLVPSKAIWLTMLKALPLIERGNYKEAQNNLEEALKLYKKEGISDDLLLAYIYKALIRAHMALGNLRETEKYVEFAYKLRPNKTSSDPKLYADILNIDGALRSEFGDYKEALKLLKQSLRARRESVGERHFSVATSLNDAGVVSGYLGLHKKALELKEQALDIRRELFGENHPDIASSLDNIGATYYELRQYKKALELHNQALDMRRELFGERHPDIARSLNNVGTAYAELGQNKKALELHNQALDMRREMFGEKHPAIADSLHNIGAAYAELGQNKKAFEVYYQALDMRRELFGETHPDIASSLNNIGATYAGLKQYEKALELGEQALEMRCELLGEDHPLTLISAYNTIKYLNNGNPEKAGRLAARFLPHIPPGYEDREFFEKHGGPYRKAKKRRGKK